MFHIERKSPVKQYGKCLRTFLALAAALLLWVTPVWAINDLLMLPAVKSPRATGSVLLDVTRAGQRLVAVGERGHVLYSDDNGQSWQQGKVPVSVTLTAVHFPGAQKGWAVGHDGVVLHSQDGGENWFVQLNGTKASQLMVDHLEAEIAAKEAELSLLAGDEQDAASFELENIRYALEDAHFALEEGASNPFLDVTFLDETTGFVVGAYGLIFRTDDGGANWQPWIGRIDNPDGFHYNAISESGDWLFMAGEAGSLYRSFDAGQSWEALESPYEGSFFGIVSDVSGEQVVAMGLRGNVFRSTDAGVSWQRLETSIESPVHGGAMLSDGRVALATRTLLLADAEGQVSPVAGVKASAYSAVAETADGQLVMVGLHGVRRVESIRLEGEDK
jgi:photosystem II stability/assembly factor-like uncharacterized protein